MKKKKIWSIAGVALIAVIVLFAMFACGDERPAADVTVHDIETTQLQPTQSELPALTLEEYRESNDAVELITTYGTLSYPFAYSDLIDEEFVDDAERKTIDFYAVLGGNRYPIYTVSFTGQGDILLGTMKLGETTCEVTADIAEDAGTLEGDDLISFRAAQETFNDIWMSMTSNENFTPAQ